MYQVKLALTLFVLRVLADDHYTAVSLDNLALITHRLYRSSNFHCIVLLVKSP